MRKLRPRDNPYSLDLNPGLSSPRVHCRVVGEVVQTMNQMLYTYNLVRLETGGPLQVPGQPVAYYNDANTDCLFLNYLIRGSRLAEC